MAESWRSGAVKVVEADPGQISRLEQAIESKAQWRPADGAAERVGEDQVHVAPAWTRRQPGLGLHSLVHLERRHNRTRQRHGATRPMRLRLGERAAAALQRLGGLLNTRFAPGQVDVPPTHPEQLPPHRVMERLSQASYACGPTWHFGNERGEVIAIVSIRHYVAVVGCRAGIQSRYLP
jgi:hypothetical protein